MSNIIFCKICIMPSTKPNLEFNKDGVCQGCVNFNNRKKIDWSEKEKQFKKIISENKSKNTNYDCVIPVSGGKDSTYQVIKALEYNLNPLCVTARTCKLTELGRFNIENIKKLGVDHFEVTPDTELRRKINKFTLETVGDISWAEHITIFTVPFRIALNLKIPLILWGENPENENGGPKEFENAINLDQRWLEEFGGLLGLRTYDLKDVFQIEEKKLIQYTFPSRNDLSVHNIKGIFLGSFFEWDGYENYKIASKHGFKVYEKELEGSIVNYENLDNAQMRVHDYFKYLKYGYDRVTDWCCWHIRRGRLTREKALLINEEKSGRFPDSYMGYTLTDILSPIQISLEEFEKICDKFTNKELFMSNNNNALIRRPDGSPLLSIKFK